MAATVKFFFDNDNIMTILRLQKLDLFFKTDKLKFGYKLQYNLQYTRQYREQFEKSESETSPFLVIYT